MRGVEIDCCRHCGAALASVRYNGCGLTDNAGAFCSQRCALEQYCRYCGGPLVPGMRFDRWGKPMQNGWYCSHSCARAVHGFDNRIAKERAHATTGFDQKKHDRICHNTREPWEYIAGEAEEDNARACDALDAMRKAAAVDPRLPGILSLIADGRTQKQIARALRVSEFTVSDLIRRLRATI